VAACGTPGAFCWIGIVRAGTIASREHWFSIGSKQEDTMTRRFALVIASVAGICVAAPACAEEVGVGVGPVGVTVGAGHDDHDRDVDKKVIIKKDHDEDGVREKKVIIKKDHDHD
jgi:hypothetical protein